MQATLSYERKIKYPAYSALRSNIQYSSPYVYESGNPMLLPQMQNDFTCILGYKDIKAMLGYTLYEDYMTQVVELYDGNPVALMRPDNMERREESFFCLQLHSDYRHLAAKLRIGWAMARFQFVG